MLNFDDPSQSVHIQLGMGVFCFPPTTGTAEEQLEWIEITLNRLNSLHEIIEDLDIKGRDCYHFTDLRQWLTRFRNLLSREGEKIKDLIDKEDSSDQNPKTTLNGHGE